MQRECLFCGMPAEVPALHIDDLPVVHPCLKCDSDLYAQSNGRLVSSDIAHQQETVDEALAKLDAAILNAWEGYSAGLRIITGGGRIREAVLGQVEYYRQQGYIRDFAADERNRGAVILRIRPSGGG